MMDASKLRKPAIIAAIIIIGIGAAWLGRGSIAPHLEGFVTDERNARPIVLEGQLTDDGSEVLREVSRVYMRGTPGEKVNVLFCRPDEINPGNDLYDIIDHPEHEESLKYMLEASYRKDPRSSTDATQFNIIAFETLGQVKSSTWKRYNMHEPRHFRCPLRHVRFHDMDAVKPTAFETVVTKVSESREAARRKPGRDGLFLGIFGVGRTDAQVLFCRPVLIRTVGNLDEVLNHPDFKDSLEEGYRKLYPNGPPSLFTIVNINNNAAIAKQTLNGKASPGSELSVDRESLFNCGGTHKEYHRMKLPYNPS